MKKLIHFFNINTLAALGTMQLFWSLPVLTVWILSVSTFTSAKEIRFQFQALDVSSLNRASDACIAIFTVNAPCPSMGDFVMPTDLSLETIELNDLLQGSCLSSLISLQNSLKEQCGSKATYKRYSDDSTWKPIFAMEEAIHNVASAYIRKGSVWDEESHGIPSQANKSH